MKGTIKANEVVIGSNGTFEGEIIKYTYSRWRLKGKFNIKNLYS